MNNLKSLDEIGLACGTDKASNHHNYLNTYEKYISQWRNDPISILELGVGGYKYPDRGGESLRMWYQYFTAAKIVGLDFHDKSGIPLPTTGRVSIMQGDQIDYKVRETIVENFGKMDLIIDDASHKSSLTIESFRQYFQVVKDGGIYIIEDTHTNYWEKEYDGKENPDMHFTSTPMGFMQKLSHQLNSEHFPAKHHWNLHMVEMIDSINFHKDFIIIRKK